MLIKYLLSKNKCNVISNCRIAKLLYFKEGELFLKEIPYFKSLEEFSKKTQR